MLCLEVVQGALQGFDKIEEMMVTGSLICRLFGAFLEPIICYRGIVCVVRKYFTCIGGVGAMKYPRSFGLFVEAARLHEDINGVMEFTLTQAP